MKLKMLLLMIVSTLSTAANAHVKWFSNYDFQQAPLQLSQLNHPYFWGLFLLSLVSLPVLVYTDKLGESSVIYQKINNFLDRYADDSALIMRVAMGAVLLMCWQADAFIAPEIAIPSPVWGWFQFALALCLLFKESTFVTGLGMIFLYCMGISIHGYFHMLDYVVYPAVGLFLIVSYAKSEKLRNLDLPILYAGLGFSLCWVAFEKLIYPYWGLSVLAKAPALTMGLPHEFFLLACAFVEFTLGYLLIICLLHRPLAVVVTLTFFTTTCFFGKTEIVGHTILHGALLVFIVKGPGHYYKAPILIHKSVAWRSAFAIVNYIVLFALLAFPYQYLANKAYAKSMEERKALEHPKLEIGKIENPPSVMVHATKDPQGGWNIHLMTENFKFTPESAGANDVIGEGHAHLYINGKKSARVYGNWFHTNLVKGANKLRVTLNTNSHKEYYLNGKPVEHEIEINEGREVSIQHAH